MPNLTPEGLRAVTDVASRHGFSLDAAQSLLESLMHGQGSQAQFSHPEFGGMGQWSRGGMIMIGDMFNQGLKYRVDALCNDLSGLLGRENFVQAPVQSFQSQSQGGGHSLFAGGTSSWWPGELGQPSSSGAQNDMRYAFFPAARRIAIQQGSTVRSLRFRRSPVLGLFAAAGRRPVADLQQSTRDSEDLGSAFGCWRTRKRRGARIGRRASSAG